MPTAQGVRRSLTWPEPGLGQGSSNSLSPASFVSQDPRMGHTGAVWIPQLSPAPKGVTFPTLF